MNYDTVLPERIMRRYRHRRLRVPHWSKQSLAIGAFALSGLALICLLAFLKPPTLRQRQETLRNREIIQRAIANAGTTPPHISATIDYRPPVKAPRATLVKLPDDHWNNVCTP